MHEVLLVPDNEKTDSHTLERMVREVNETQVCPEDKLSDHVYHYDSQTKIFEIAESYEKRQMKKELSHGASVLGELNHMKDECASRMKDIGVNKKETAEVAVI